MCGIAGIFSFNKTDVSRERLQSMNDALMHRGPDGEYIEFVSHENVYGGMGHRRLAIIDRTETGIQPMHYLERYVLVHNGEIYNYKELRAELQSKGLKFHTQSDTEVIAAAYHFFGRDCLQYFDGMFAFAIWDEKDQKLFCARDRFGEKPFYYHFDQEKKSILFASEMKALWSAGIRREIDNAVLFQYLTTGQARVVWQPARTFYKDILQLPPSHYLEWNAQSPFPEISHYWDLDKETIIDIGEEEAEKKLTELLEQSVSRRLRSDVALGSSISGGLDSSVLATICSSTGGNRYSHNSFSAVFPGFEKDESAFISEINARCGLKSGIIFPDAAGLIENIEKMLAHQEEPIGSSSVFAQWLVYRLAMENHVTVLLDGQGADEIFAGYERYSKWHLQEYIAANRWKKASNESQSLKGNEYLNDWGMRNYISAKLPGVTNWLLERKMARKQRQHPELNKTFVENNYDRNLIHKPFVEKLNDILYFDTMQGPLQELLQYADRNSMAWGRELRLPFLSHELVQFVFSLPAGFKIRNGYNKWILRHSYRNRVPEKIVWRKGKTGFEPPQKSWMYDKQVQQKINESKELLVEKNILSPRVLKRSVKPSSAYDENNWDWRYWIAGILCKD